MRKYIDAELKIVRLTNDVIATSFARAHEAQGYDGGVGGFSGSRLDFDDDEFDY